MGPVLEFSSLAKLLGAKVEALVRPAARTDTVDPVEITRSHAQANRTTNEKRTRRRFFEAQREPYRPQDLRNQGRHPMESQQQKR
eukprot:6185469-Pleurochrysis_carterae.AAC.1